MGNLTGSGRKQVIIDYKQRTRRRKKKRKITEKADKSKEMEKGSQKCISVEKG